MAAGEPQVWTGTLSLGTRALDHCAGWTINGATTGMTGLWTSSTSTWTADSSAECTVARRLYCIEYPQ